MIAPVSQISAGALPASAAAKKLVLVTSLLQPIDHSGARRLGMTAILLEHKRELLANELRS